MTKRCCEIADNNAIRLAKPAAFSFRTALFINPINMRASFLRGYQERSDKLKTFEQLLNIYRSMRRTIAYLSNDLPDLLSIIEVGLSVEKSPFPLINKGHRMIPVNGDSQAVQGCYDSILWTHQLKEVKGLPA